MKAYKCDNCHKLYEEYTQDYDFGSDRITIELQKLSDNYLDNYKSVDYCPSCAHKLIKSYSDYLEKRILLIPKE